MTFNQLRIAQKLPFLIIGASFVLGLGLGLIGYIQSSTTVDDEVQKKLEVALISKKSALIDYLTSIQEDLSITASNLMVIDSLKDFKKGWKDIGENPEKKLQELYITENSFPTGEKEKLDFAADGSSYSAAHKKYHPWFRKMLYTNEYYDIFLFDMQGNLVYSVFKELDYATNLQNGKWKGSGLGDVFRGSLKSLKEGHLVFIDFMPYAPSADAPASFIGTPVFSEGKAIGVLAYQMPISRINNLMQDATGLGKTGESYIVGSDYLMRSDSRFSEESTILSRRVDTASAKAAISGDSGSTITADYRGVTVKSVFAPLDFMGTRWAILAEIDEAEYFEPIADMRNSMALVGIVLLIIVGTTGVLFARNIVRSLQTITAAAKNLADGDVQSAIPMRDKADEIGELANAIQIFQDNALEINRLEKERLDQEAVEETRKEEERVKLEEQLVVAAENMRIRVALDNCAANIMVVDKEGKIAYLNKAVFQLMKRSELEIRKDISNFDVEKLVGKEANLAFQSSANKKAMIEQLKASEHKKLQFGSKIFELVTSPVVSDQQEFLGSTLEWKDITQELSVQDEIDTLVSAVVAGDFSKSVSLEGKEGFMLKLAEAMNQLNVTINSVVDDVAAALSALAEGKLTHQIAKDYEGTYDQLKEDSNKTSDQLREIVGKIIFSAGKIGNSAHDIKAGSRDLSQRTDSQASGLQQTAATMKQLADTVKQNATNAQQANRLAIDAHKIAEKGGEVVSRSIDAMSGIEESSQKVSEIISVIDEIAFQTNLLALNASVEAARAGDAGKGFAVVAAEVGILAQRTATAAKDVKNLITSSENQIKGGVDLTNDTGNALNEIVGAIKNVTDIISEITAASEEQARGIEETNNSISSMDQITQQNAALVQQSLASAEELETESVSVSDLIRFFDLGKGGSQKSA